MWLTMKVKVIKCSVNTYVIRKVDKVKVIDRSIMEAQCYSHYKVSQLLYVKEMSAGSQSKQFIIGGSARQMSLKDQSIFMTSKKGWEG